MNLTMDLAKKDLAFILDFIEGCRSARQRPALQDLVSRLIDEFAYDVSSVGFCEVSERSGLTEKQALVRPAPAASSRCRRLEYDLIETARPACRDTSRGALVRTPAPPAWEETERSGCQIEEGITLVTSAGLSRACYNEAPSSRALCMWLNSSLEQAPFRERHILQFVLPHLYTAMTRAKDPVPAERSVVLTDRENQVLSWAQEGKSNWEIGKILSISERTVKFHMANICDKLEVSNRSHAIAKALRCGLI